MTKYYSPSIRGFYDTDAMHSSYPDDMIELTDEYYTELLTSAHSGTKEIYVDNNQVLLRDIVPIITWEGIRVKRNRLLEKSDYTQMPDWPGNKNTWAIYRQSLRDIPQTFSTPEEVVWPIDPEE
jgi:hypothetical protein